MLLHSLTFLCIAALASCTPVTSSYTLYHNPSASRSPTTVAPAPPSQSCPTNCTWVVFPGQEVVWVPILSGEIYTTITVETVQIIVDQANNKTRTTTKSNAIPEGISRGPTNAAGTQIYNYVGEHTNITFAFPTGATFYPNAWNWGGTLLTTDAAGQPTCNTVGSGGEATLPYHSPIVAATSSLTTTDPYGYGYRVDLKEYLAPRTWYDSIGQTEGAIQSCTPNMVAPAQPFKTAHFLTETQTLTEGGKPTTKVPTSSPQSAPAPIIVTSTKASPSLALSAPTPSKVQPPPVQSSLTVVQRSSQQPSSPSSRPQSPTPPAPATSKPDTFDLVSTAAPSPGASVTSVRSSAEESQRSDAAAASSKPPTSSPAPLSFPLPASSQSPPSQQPPTSPLPPASIPVSTTTTNGVATPISETNGKDMTTVITPSNTIVEVPTPSPSTVVVVGEGSSRATGIRQTNTASSTVVVVGSNTIPVTPGSPSATSPAIVVFGSTTYMVVPTSAPILESAGNSATEGGTKPSTQPGVVVIASSTYIMTRASEIVIRTQTLRPGGPPVTTSDTAVSIPVPTAVSEVPDATSTGEMDVGGYIISGIGGTPGATGVSTSVFSSTTGVVQSTGVGMRSNMPSLVLAGAMVMLVLVLAC